MNAADAAIIGSVTASTFSLLSFFLNSYFEKSKQRRELAIKVALEIWRRKCENTDKANKNLGEYQKESPIRLENFADPDFVKIFDEILRSLKSFK